MIQRDGATQTSIISGGVAKNAGNGANGGGFGGNQMQGNFGGNMGGGLGGIGGNNNGVSNGTTINTNIETNFWKDLEKSLLSMLGNAEGRSVLVSPQAGLVSVRALPDELKTIRHFCAPLKRT